MDKKRQPITHEELLQQLKRKNPQMHRVFIAFEEARKNCKEGIPDAFAYVRALKEYDKKYKLKVKKGEYNRILNEYDKIMEPFLKPYHEH